MPQRRVKNIDSDMCKRVQIAFTRLGMTYEAIAADAGIPSKAQLIEVANGVMEPSKRILRYLCSKGFSAHWLFTGEGTVLWMDKGISLNNSSVLTKQLKKEINAVTNALNTCSKQIEELRSTLNAVIPPKRAKGPSTGKK